MSAVRRAVRSARRARMRMVDPLRARGHFRFRGTRYRYLVHRYNATLFNERTVEVPIVARFLAQHPGRSLEVGNVLGHYGIHTDVVVDKYEVGDGVRNIDVLDIDDGPFDVIVAISTMEHVGWDEQPRDGTKAGRAIDHLRSQLAPEGHALFTVPYGHNPSLDQLIERGDEAAVWSGSLVRAPRRRIGPARWDEGSDLRPYSQGSFTAQTVWIACYGPA